MIHLQHGQNDVDLLCSECYGTYVNLAVQNLWTVDCGLWTVDCGLWTVDCGRLVNSVRNEYNGGS